MRAVTVDLWETLITERAGGAGQARRRARVDGVRTALAAIGHPTPADRVDAAMMRTRDEFDADHDRGIDIPFVDRVQQMLNHLDPDLPQELGQGQFAAIVKAVDDPFLEHPPQAVGGVEEILGGLKASGCAVALISNTGFTSAGVYRAWFERLGWLRHFDTTSFSNDLAVAKPSRAIFVTTLATLGVGPADALHVGDSGRHDVDGGKAAGLSTVWITTGRPGAPSTVPDYSIDRLSELPLVVQRWRSATA